MNKSANAESAWQATLNRVASAVVCIQISAVRAWETDNPSFSYATGFVVDKKLGIVLTNRHVVTTGPVKLELTLLNNEEVACKPIYRDPEHDFGFIQYNPADVKFAAIEEIPLHPTGAQVGVSVRVVGNDAGEKMSILPGTISRLDREAPRYGSNTYNESNTFYIAAASSTSGGSSGSPVLDILGRAVAMNAGGKTSAATSFFLPLQRAARALACVRAGLQVPRGGLLGVWEHQPFDAVRRHGLQPATEAWIRHHTEHEHGMLVLDSTVKQGPLAQAGFQPGDVLVAMNPRFQQHTLQVNSHASPALSGAGGPAADASGLDALCSLDATPVSPDLASVMESPVPSGPPGTPALKPMADLDLSPPVLTASHTLPGTQPLTHFLPLEEACDNTLAVVQAVKQALLPVLRAALRRPLTTPEIDNMLQKVADSAPTLVPVDDAQRDELRERCMELVGEHGLVFETEPAKLNATLASADADSHTMTLSAEPGIGAAGWGRRAARPSLPQRSAWSDSYLGVCSPGADDQSAPTASHADLIGILSPLSTPPESDFTGAAAGEAGAPELNHSAVPLPLTKLAGFVPIRVLENTRKLVARASPSPVDDVDDHRRVAERKLPALEQLCAMAVRGFDRSVRAGESLLRGLAKVDFAAAALGAELDKYAQRTGGAAVLESERMLAAAPLVLALAGLDPLVDLVVERSGQRVCKPVRVANLHAAMPRQLCEVSNAVLHDLSLTLATNLNEPLCREAVFLAYGGYMFGQAGVPAHSLLRSVGEVSTRSLRDIERAFQNLPDGARVPVRFSTRNDTRTVRTAIVKVDRHWAAAGLRRRCDATGLWHLTAWPAAPAANVAEVSAGTIIQHSLPGVPPAVQTAFNACTIVKVSHAVLPDGLHGTKFRGVGMLIDAQRGLVLVDRSTASSAVGDMWVTVTGTVELEARPVFFHPHANFAILALSRMGLKAGASLPAVPPLSDTVPDVGSKCTFVGMSDAGEPIVHTATITKTAHSILLPNKSPPRYRSINEAVLTVDRIVNCLGGLYLNEAGEVIAFLSAYSYTSGDGDDEMWGAMPLHLPCAALRSIAANSPAQLLLPPPAPARQPVKSALSLLGDAGNARPGLPGAPQWLLDVEWRPVPLSDAVSGLGLADKWANAVTARQGTRRQLMSVARTRPDTMLDELLHSGDLLLSVQDFTPTTPHEVMLQLIDVGGSGAKRLPKLPGASAQTLPSPAEEKDSKSGDSPAPTASAARAPVPAGSTTTSAATIPAVPTGAPALTLRILRDGKELDISAVLRKADGLGTRRVLLWAGMVLQSAHDPCFSWGNVPSTGAGTPYISRWSYGSPCHRFGIRAAQWLTHLNDTPLGSLDDMLAAIHAAGSATANSSVAMRLRTETLRGKTLAHTIRTDSTYWPSVELTRDAWGTWTCNLIPTS